MTATKQQQHHDEETSNGTNEHNKHIEAIKYKTKMCRNWVTKGACPYNDKCMFAHGDNELRSVSLNTNQGLETEDDIRRFRRSGHGVGDNTQHQSPVSQRPRNESGRPYPPARGGHQPYPQPQSYHHNPYQVPSYDYYGAPQDGPCQCAECVGPRGYDYRAYYAPPPPQSMPCPCEECAQAAGYAYPYGPESEYPPYTDDAVHPPAAECVAP